MNDSIVRDRARGTLVGLAVGDALGAPVEFDDPQDIIGRDNELWELPGGGGWDPGEFTDDTQMAVILARHLANGTLKKEPLAREFADWAFHPATKDVGLQTSGVLFVIKNGQSIEKATAGLTDGQSGNGSLMRVAPVALRYLHSTAQAQAIARDQSSITHPSPLCTESCALFVSMLIDNILSSGATTTDWIRSFAESGPLTGHLELSGDAPEMAGWVIPTLRGAIWAVDGASGFEDAVWRAVSLGHDADTVGAVTGALAGAKWGLEAIPRQVMTKLSSNHPTFQESYPEYLIELADALMTQSPRD